MNLQSFHVYEILRGFVNAIFEIVIIWQAIFDALVVLKFTQ